MHRHGMHHLRNSHVPCSPFAQQGKFGRLFPTLPPHQADARDLEALGVKDGLMDEGNNDVPSDSTTIPAGFTFLGQFIDHDITFDPTSSLERQNDPTAIRNFRTPLLELDSVYGAGPEANPYLFDQGDPAKLLIGTLENPNDLPRNRQGTALIGDPRNDENLIVSQLQLAFLKFHNAVVDYLREQGIASQTVFEEAQRLVRWHYQWIIVHEFLPLTVGQHLVDDILQNGPKYYHPGQRPFIPVEFSVAAYRFGHSQVRAVYKVNKKMTRELFDLPFFAPIQPDQIVDWSNFFHISSSNAPQFSRRIDAKLTRTLLDLQPPIVPPGTPDARRSLAVRNLKRGASFSLPTGQTVAKAMGLKPLSDEELGLAELDLPGKKGFKGEAPLWFYILKEAEIQTNGETLGQVGGRIVGEVLLGLLKADAMSYFNLEPRWQPDSAIAPKGQFADLLKFAGVYAAPSATVATEPTPALISEHKHSDVVTLASSGQAPPTAGSMMPAPSSVVTKRLAGQLRLGEVEILAANGGTSPNLLRHDCPFDMQVTLDLTEVAISDKTSLSYTAKTFAKSLDNGSRQIIGEAHDLITSTDTFVINIASKGLPAGLYRLETAVALNVLPDEPSLTALLEGSLLQVF